MYEIRPEIYRFADDIVFKALISQQRKEKDKNLEPKKPTILVVDDQQMLADTTADILNQSGFRASRAYAGHSALEMVRKLRPEYLLTDVLMPGMNGVELAITVKKELPMTRIVLFSGQAGITDILRRAKEDGYVFELLAKPVHPEKLVEFLRRKQC
jgi:CheY-like chemotaxis protein